MHLDEVYYADLRMPSGMCKYYDESLKQCSIYEKRPLKCRIDDYYKEFLHDTMSKKQFYQLNSDGCIRLMMKEADFEHYRLMLKHTYEISLMKE